MALLLKAAAVAAVVAALAACAGPRGVDDASGGGVPQSLSLSAVFSQRFQAQTDRRLQGDDAAVFGSTTRLGGVASLTTPRAGVSLEAGASASGFAGAGDTDGLNRIDPDVRAEAYYRAARMDLSSSLDFDIQPTSITQVEDTGVTTRDSEQISLRLGGDLAYLVNARNRLSLGADASVIRFTRNSPDLTPTTVYGVTGGWVHDLDPRTSATLSLGLRRFIARNDERERSTTVNLGGRLSHQVSSRLSLSGGAGVNVVDRVETIGAVRDSETLVSGSGGLEIAWTPTADLGFAMAVDHNLSPSSSGDLQNATTVALDADYAINDLVRAGLSLGYIRRDGLGEDRANGGGVRHLYSVSPSLGVQLDDDWRLEVSYVLRVVDEPGVNAASNSVALNLARAFDLAR